MPTLPDHRRATLAIGLLCALAVAYLAALEIGARVLYPLHSALAARIGSDWSAARHLGGARSQNRRTFLVVGNSLLQAGVDRNELGALQKSSSVSVAVMPIENTAYLDWYFGLRRLFAEGSEPEFVVLCLVPEQLISDETDGEVFARTLMRPADILRVKQAARLDWTTTSTYLMARASAWMGNSAEIRNWIRSETVPGMTELAAYFPPPPGAIPRVEVIEEIAGQRLREFSTLCAVHGCKALLLIPALLRHREDASLEAVARAARSAGVPLLMPVDPGVLGPSFFRDGFHLNERGAAVFTARLLEALAATGRAEAATTPTPSAQRVPPLVPYNPDSHSRNRPRQ